jgi:serine/threonine protein kinase
MFDFPGTPSLNKRLSLAVTLLDTLLNLHTSGWLHKELQSDNIIFIRNSDCDIDDGLTSNLSSYSVFVSGYVYSRLDNPDEVTESMRSEAEADLYRHPFLLTESRKSYSKTLDIFSVGCTLLEIGLWSSLRQILENHSTIVSRTSLLSVPNRPRVQLAQSRSSSSAQNHGVNIEQAGGSSLDLMKLKQELLLSPLRIATGQTNRQNNSFQDSTPSIADRSIIMRSLEAAMGTRYTKIVEECLTAGDLINDGNADEHEFALELEMKARDTVQDILKAI